MTKTASTTINTAAKPQTPINHFFISCPFYLTQSRFAAGKIRCPSTGPYSSAASSPPLRAAASASLGTRFARRVLFPTGREPPQGAVTPIFSSSQVPWHPRFCQHYTKSPSSRIAAHRGKSARNRGSVAPRRTAIPDSTAAILPPHCSVAERRSPLQYVTGRSFTWRRGFQPR